MTGSARFAIWAPRITNARLPLWLRVVAYAEAHADETGGCSLAPHELHHAIDATLTKSAVSRAIRTAIDVGMLAQGSSARRLTLSRATHSRSA